MTDKLDNAEGVVELKACPFCGGEGLMHRTPWGWQVTCSGCGASPRNNSNVNHETKAGAAAVWNTRTPSPEAGMPIEAVTEEMIEAAGEAVHDFLDERFPGGAMPGGQQLFADDRLDAEFKHEVGCDELAAVVLKVALRAAAPPAPKPKREVDLTREEAIERFGQPNKMGHITRCSDSSIYDEKCVRCGMVDQAKRNINNTPCPAKPAPAPVQDDDAELIDGLRTMSAAATMMMGNTARCVRRSSTTAITACSATAVRTIES